MSDAEHAGVRLDGRWVPFPASISPEARANLQRMVGPDGQSLRASVTRPPADDLAAWATEREVFAANIALSMGPRLPHIKASSETIDLGGALVYRATPETLVRDDCAYVDLHGGGLVHGEGEFCRIGALTNAHLLGVRSYAVDYRMPPEHPYPAALDDCVAAYRALLEQYAPDKIIVGGVSAGGNLAAALALRARDEGLPLPAAVVLITPELDLTESGDSFETNRHLDVVLPLPLMGTNILYAAGHDLAHPYLSPLFGDFTRGFPPTFLQCGTRDLFLSNTVRMHRALRKAKIPAELHVFEGMPHAGFMGAPEDIELAQEKARFVAEHWGPAKA